MESIPKTGSYDGSYRASSFIGSSASSKKQLLQDLYTASLAKKYVLIQTKHFAKAEETRDIAHRLEFSNASKIYADAARRPNEVGRSEKH